MVLTPVLYRYHLGIIYCDINQRHILIHASFHSVQIRFQAHHWHIFNALFFQHQQGIFLLTDLCLFDVNLLLLISHWQVSSYSGSYHLIKLYSVHSASLILISPSSVVQII